MLRIPEKGDARAVVVLLLAGALLCLVSMCPAGAQFPGTSTRQDTSSLPNRFHAWKIDPGQRVVLQGALGIDSLLIGDDAGSSGQVPMNDGGGVLTWQPAGTDTTAHSLVRRDAGGRAQGASPVNPADLVNLRHFNANAQGTQGFTKADTFYANGTWTRPTGVEWVWVDGCGGGGAGRADGNRPTGGNAANCATGFPVYVSGNVTITIGMGGATNAADGGNTSFGNLLVLSGGDGGQNINVTVVQDPCVFGSFGTMGALGAGTGMGRAGPCGFFEGGGEFGGGASSFGSGGTQGMDGQTGAGGGGNATGQPFGHGGDGFLTIRYLSPQ